MRRPKIWNRAIVTAVILVWGGHLSLLPAQMRDRGGTMGGGGTQSNGMMNGSTGPMFGSSMPFADSGMMGTQMGMNVAPFINNGTLYSLTLNLTFQPGPEDSLTANEWIFAAYDLSGFKQWSLTLNSDLLLDPAFGPDGKIFLVGHEGMGNMFQRMRYSRDGSSAHTDPPFSSTLHIIFPGASNPTVKDVPFSGEWASNVSIAPHGNSYWIYLTSRTFDSGSGGMMTGSTQDQTSNLPKQYIYGFDSQGNQQFKNEIK